jgi:hypothetical protein
VTPTRFTNENAEIPAGAARDHMLAVKGEKTPD